MVVQKVLGEKWIEQKEKYAFAFGILFPLCAFITSYLLFHNIPVLIGISTILFTVLLIIPTVLQLFTVEENIITHKGSFYVKHKDVMDFFIYFFIGSFLMFFLLAFLFPTHIFSNGQFQVQEVEGNLPPPPPSDTQRELFSFFQNNLYIMGIAFIISLFYGSGAMFLITLNASIFASVLAQVTKASMPQISTVSNLTYTLCQIGIMFVHMIPEVLAYLIAAIAGGVLSRGFLKEKIKSKKFIEVLKDAILLLVIAIGVLFVAAFLESYVSRQLFQSDVCLQTPFIALGAGVVLFLIILGVEVHRKRHIAKRKL